eukprot:437136_1
MALSTETKRNLLRNLHDHCKGKLMFSDTRLKISNLCKDTESMVQNTLENVFACIPQAFVYLDRVIIASSDDPKNAIDREHALDLSIQVFDVLARIGGAADAALSRVGFRELKYSNGIISTDGVKFNNKLCSVNKSRITSLFKKKKACFHCKTKRSTGNKLKLCSQCKNAYYCNKYCQKRSWNLIHRHVCKR